MEETFQPVENDLTTYSNIPKIDTRQGVDYTTGCLLDFLYFKQHYKMIVIVLTKQEALDANPKAIQQINFTGDLNRPGDKTIQQRPPFMKN